MERRVIVIGGGPAGLTAAYELTRLGIHATVLEKRDKVGGLACTERYRGFRFDMGGHRFFTKVDPVNRIWREILGDELLLRPRLSRIYYNRKFFHYPLHPLNALAGLGFRESLLVILSYLRWQLLPYRQEETFEQWVTNRFGSRLFRTFFKTYTEKVWGISCSELRAGWAAQRIKDLSLKTAVLSMFIKPRKTIRTLIDEFHYPSLGPGMMWNAMRREIERKGAVVRLDCTVTGIQRSGARIGSATISSGDREEIVRGDDFISSMPISELILKLDPPAPPHVREAARHLRYRDFLTVCLILRKPDLFPDNWIYIHSPEVKVGRIQNFKNWSPSMVPDPARSSLGLEYFCAEGDELWRSNDEDLVDLGKREVEKIGLASRSDIEDGCVFRVPKAYPVYDARYPEHLATLRQFVEGIENCETIGRNGLHRYNNQDHAMLTGMLAARNVVLGERNDIWGVNTDREYLEEVRAEAGQEASVRHAVPSGATSPRPASG